MPLLLLLWAFLAMTAAQPRCDPVTQYAKNGECCTMCGPGTSMMSIGTCLEPQCKPCGDAEYQENYTNKTKCGRQPYCDTNLNFDVPVHDKKKQTTCTCKWGFHCTSTDCLTCSPHTACKPGLFAKTQGDHMHDTVCQECPEGTFSSETSLDGVCHSWTKCGYGHKIARPGTGTSDNICEEIPRQHIIVAVLIAVGVIAVVILVLTLLCYKSAGEKKCFGSCRGVNNEPVKLLTINPHDPDDEESTLNEVHTQQEEGCSRSPVESDYPSLVMLSDIHNGQLEGCTDNGNLVAQENGKSDRLSRQESQTQAFVD